MKQSPWRRLKLPYLVLRRRILLLLLMAVLTAILGGAFAAAGAAQLEEGRFPPITIGIVSGTQDKTAQMLLDQVAKNKGLFPNISIVSVDSEEAARQGVESGALSGALLLPSDLLSWVNGYGRDNPVLIVQSLSSVEHAVFTTIGNSFLRMLTVAQRGVSLALQAFELENPRHISYDFAWMGVNLVYFSIAFDQLSRFEDQQVSGPASLSYAVHTMLCIGFCFCLLLTPVLHDKLSLRANEGWIRRMNSIGRSPWQNATGQIAVCTGGFMLLLALLVGGLAAVMAMLGEEVALSPLLLLALVVGALFFACFTFVLANLGNPLLGGVLCCLIGILSLITAGGLLPKVLLPRVLQSLSAFSPILWLRNLFAASIQSNSTAWVVPLLSLLAVSGALFGCSFLLCHQKRRASA